MAMARLARITIPGVAHHVTQRGNRSMEVFFSEDDYRAYLELLAEYGAKAGTAVWAYCLMPNHIHLILVPSHDDGLRAALGEVHRRYARRINAREEWSGHLWQERFHSYPMDEDHLVAGARYVELNPVRAGLVERPEDWRWSSAKAHLSGEKGGLVDVAPLLERIPDWAAFLEAGTDQRTLETIRHHTRTGHPLGSKGFLDKLEGILGRDVQPRKPGRPRKKSE